MAVFALGEKRIANRKGNQEIKIYVPDKLKSFLS